MEAIKEYVRPELLIVVIVLYFIGLAIKNSEFIKDKYIPIILGIIGILIAGVYVVATSDRNSNSNFYINNARCFSGWIECICKSIS